MRLAVARQAVPEDDRGEDEHDQATEQGEHWRSSAVELVRQPQADLREGVEHDHRDDHDDHIRHHAAENVVDVDPRRRHALEIERRHGDRRRQERGLDVERHQEAEEQRIDIEDLEQRQEDRHEDDDDLGPFQRPAQDEDDELGEDHESGLVQVERQHEPLDRLVAAQIGEHGREGERADEQPAHHGGGAGGEEHRLLELGERERRSRYQRQADEQRGKQGGGNDPAIDIQIGQAADHQVDEEQRHQHAVDLHQQQVAPLGIVGAVGDREQERTERAHGGGLRRRRQPEDDRAERGADQSRQRQERRDQRPEYRLVRDVALLRRQLGRQLRIEQRHNDRVEDVEAGEHDAGEERAGVELHHRHAGGCAVEDEHHARRDENAKTAARAHDAGRELHVVAGAQHRRKSEQPHQRDAGADNSGRSREDRAGRERGERQRRRDRPGGKLQRTEQTVENVGALDEVAHEHEQRDRDQHVVRHHRVGALHQQLEDQVAHREVAEEDAKRHQGEGDGKAEHDEDDEQGEHQHAQLGIGKAEHQAAPL